MKNFTELTTTKSSKKITPRIFSTLLLMAFCLLTSTSFAQATDYHIRLKTADQYGAGCNNDIRLEIIGTDGSTGKFWVRNSSKKRNGIDNFSITGKSDVGNITKIKVEIKRCIIGWDGNWMAEYIYVTKGKTFYEKDAEGGYYEFVCNKWFGKSKSACAMTDPVSITPTYSKKPRITVTPNGQKKIDRILYTKVNFGENLHPSVNQEIMRFEESWSFAESISMSKTKENSVGASLTVSYESPETVYGKFGAEVSASWSQAISNTSEEGRENMRSSIYNWGFIAPANSYVFKKIVFEIKYGAQVFTDGNESRIVRSLDSEIMPIGSDKFLYIPRKSNGKVVPLAWTTIENEWLKYADPAVKDDIIRNYKNMWISKGWVYERNSPSTPAPSTKTIGYGKGNQEDEYLVGDWNGDGKDNIAVRRGNQILMDFGNGVNSEKTVGYGKGNQEDAYLVGDWNGDGKNNIAVRRGNQILMDFGNGVNSEKTQSYGTGNGEDEYIVGDWNGDGKDNIAVRRGNQIIMDFNFDGVRDKVVTFGNGNQEDEYLVGDWNGDGKDEIAVRRGRNIVIQ